MLKRFVNTISNETRASLLITLSGVFYGSLGFLGMNLIHANLSVATVLFWRFFISSCILISYCYLRSHSLRTTFRSALVSFLYGALFYSPSAILYFLTSVSIGTGVAMVIFFTYPAWVVLLVWIIQNQRPTKMTAFCIFVIFLGLSLLNTPDELTLSLNGTLFGIFSSIFYAFYVYFSKSQLKNISPISSTFFLCLGCSFTFLVYSLFENSLDFPRKPEHFRDLLAISLIGTVIPAFLLLEGMKVVHAAKAAILSVFEPIVTLLLGYFLLNETLNYSQGLGIAIILIAATLSQVEDSFVQKVIRMLQSSFILPKLSEQDIHTQD